MKFSLTIGGIVTMIALPLLVKLGFSESCSNEIVAIAPMLPGAIMAWVGRVRQGDINMFGFKKPA